MTYKYEESKEYNIFENKFGEENDTIRIFGEEFVKNNRNKAVMCIKNKKYKLQEYLRKNICMENIFRIKLIPKDNIYNISYMFKDCYSLLELFEYGNEQISDKNESNEEFEGANDNNEDTLIYFNYEPRYQSFISNVTKTDYEIEYHTLEILQSYQKRINEKINNNIFDMMFYECDSLNSLTNILKFNSENSFSLSHMFYNCKKLKELPDISGWNTANVIDMGEIFCNCSSLKSLPDISFWNTSNVKNMRGIFSNCSSLQSLPDISKWKTDNATYMNNMFFNCSSLESYLIYLNGILIMLQI